MSATGFAKYRKQGGGSSKTLVTVKGVVADGGVNKLQVVDTAGKDMKIAPKSADRSYEAKKFPQGTQILISGLENVGDGEFKPGFEEVVNRYPGIDRAVKLSAAGIDMSRNGKPYVKILAPEASQKIDGKETAAAAVSAALTADVVPCQDSDRGIFIRYQDAEGKWTPVVAQDFFVGATKQEDGSFKPNDLKARAAEIGEMVAEAVGEEMANGAKNFEVMPFIRMNGSQNMVAERGGNARFKSQVAEFVTGEWTSQNGQKSGFNYGVQATIASFKPRYDLDWLKAEIGKKAGDMAEDVINGFEAPNGKGYNTSGMALWLKSKGVDISAAPINGWFCVNMTPSGYPSPVPMTTVATPHAAPEYTRPQQGQQQSQEQSQEQGQQQSQGHESNLPDLPDIPEDQLGDLDAEIDNLELPDPS